MRARRDVRLTAAALVIATVVAAGSVVSWLTPGNRARPNEAAVSVGEAREVHQRFQQGVAMLHAKRYEFAIAALHRVLELAPEMPEAHVNMGFALLGLERHAAARDFFETAIALRRDQVNAYYGLAVALEGLHDTAGAVGAMRAYIHLAGPADRYRVKAQSALWEWEAALAKARAASAAK